MLASSAGWADSKSGGHRAELADSNREVRTLKQGRPDDGANYKKPGHSIIIMTSKIEVAAKGI